MDSAVLEIYRTASSNTCSCVSSENLWNSVYQQHCSCVSSLNLWNGVYQPHCSCVSSQFREQQVATHCSYVSSLNLWNGMYQPHCSCVLSLNLWNSVYQAHCSCVSSHSYHNFYKFMRTETTHGWEWLDQFEVTAVPTFVFIKWEKRT